VKARDSFGVSGERSGNSVGVHPGVKGVNGCGGLLGVTGELSIAGGVRGTLWLMLLLLLLMLLLLLLRLDGAGGVDTPSGVTGEPQEWTIM